MSDDRRDAETMPVRWHGRLYLVQTCQYTWYDHYQGAWRAHYGHTIVDDASMIGAANNFSSRRAAFKDALDVIRALPEEVSHGCE